MLLVSPGSRGKEWARNEIVGRGGGKGRGVGFCFIGVEHGTYGFFIGELKHKSENLKHGREAKPVAQMFSY